MNPTPKLVRFGSHKSASATLTKKPIPCATECSPPASTGSARRSDRDEFLAIFGEVFESSAWVAGDAWAAGPFESLDCLHHAMVEAMHAADRSKRLALIEAHPDLAKRVSGADPMSTASTAEQTRAGLTSLGRDEQRRFLELNAAYRKRFGFPFIIAVKGLDKPAILAAFEARLENPPELEFEGALGEIAKIARFRLADISISWAAERLPRLSSR